MAQITRAPTESSPNDPPGDVMCGNDASAVQIIDVAGMARQGKSAKTDLAKRLDDRIRRMPLTSDQR